jgi:tRNA pseudouridine38-40 synthase
MNKKNFKCTVSYRGTAYYGWQRQTKFTTVQGMLEYALEKFFGREIKTTGASRTDAGVHAYGQSVSFQIETKMPAYNVMRVLNDLLPPDIRIMSCAEAEGFNARWNVRKKFYRYLIHNSAITYPMFAGLCWQLPGRLDTGKMKKALPLFIGEKNYFSFSSSSEGHKDHVRKIDSIKIQRQGKWIIIDLKARSFLYNMIRKIVSSLVSFAQGELSLQDIERMFKKEDRSINKHMAPADGLYLVKIIYNRNAEVGTRKPELKEETEDED